MGRYGEIVNREMVGNVKKCILKTIKKKLDWPSIWVNYNNSLTWIVRPFGDDLPYYDFQWARSEVVIIYPESMAHSCYRLSPAIPTKPGRISSLGHGTWDLADYNERLVTHWFHENLQFETHGTVSYTSIRILTYEKKTWQSPGLKSWSPSGKGLIPRCKLVSKPKPI